MTATAYIEDHPAMAFIVGGIHLLIAETLNTLEIPTIIMQVFQVGAWAVTMAVGAVSLVGAYKKWNGK